MLSSGPYALPARSSASGLSFFAAFMKNTLLSSVYCCMIWVMLSCMMLPWGL